MSQLAGPHIAFGMWGFVFLAFFLPVMYMGILIGKQNTTRIWPKEFL